MDLESVRLLMDHHYWATRRVLGVLAGLTPEQFTQTVTSSFPSIQATVAHMINAEAVWLGRILGVPLRVTQPEEIANGAGAAEPWSITEQAMRGLVSGLDAEGFGRVIRFATRSGKEFADPVWLILHQLFNHGSYHRGQLTTLIRQVGAQPVQTDLIVYYRELPH